LRLSETSVAKLSGDHTPLGRLRFLQGLPGLQCPIKIGVTLEMAEHNLSLRPIGENEYSVMREDRAVGRIQLADERPDHEMWEWAIDPQLPVPSWGVGRAPSFDEAKTAFQAAWERSYERRRQPTLLIDTSTRTAGASGLSGWDGQSLGYSIR
jgi:hypothetical protein